MIVNKMKKMNERDSNFELLRILCMFGVLVNHALQSLYELHTKDITLAGTLRIALMNVTIVSVNCFLLLSGWFRIKTSAKGVLKLYFQLLFYGVFAFFMRHLILHEPISMYSIKRLVFPLTENGLWFMYAYLGLYLFSPLLNTGIENLTNHKLNFTLLCLLLIDVYLGYMHQKKEITINGYHLIHFIVLYFIGAWLYKNQVLIYKYKKMILPMGGYY